MLLLINKIRKIMDEMYYLHFMFLEADITYEIVATLAFHSRECENFPAFGINFLQIRKNYYNWERIKVVYIPLTPS
jgi:hypothetical protein